MPPPPSLCIETAMLGISSNGTVCARCALRRRIANLQQRRLRSTAEHHDTRRNSGPNIRYELSKSEHGEGKGPPRRSMPVAGSNFIRKFGKKDLSDWGLDSKSLASRKEQSFREALMKRLNLVKEEVQDAPVLEELAEDAAETGGRREQSFNKLWKNFVQKIHQSEGHGGDALGGNLGFLTDSLGKSAKKNDMWTDLKEAWSTRGINGLDDRIKYAFYGHVTGSRFTESDMRNQKTLADLRYPTEWYPATRSLHRSIHLHVGPTNSGKTYQALQRLEQAKRGVYAGPLRLLAHEVYTRLNAKGKSCALITGEERRAAEGQAEDADMSACTVEMMPLNKSLDVAVIDEIQMVGNAERGWAWTQAILGVKAKELHLCGEERTVPLLRELFASIGEKVEVHRYERLSPLQMAPGSLDGKLGRLRKGDCIVSFSVMGIHALRREIEKKTGRKAAIIYGSLPPETRAQQARLFNDPNNEYDYLVASDAVGMGLNLAIRRIVFETSSKWDGLARRTLAIADIKQIGGRAGRFRTAAQANEAPASEQDLAAAKGEPAPEGTTDTSESVGLVTTLERFDFPIVQTAMESDPEPIQSAGIFPPAPVLERFASYFPPRTPFSYILTRLHDISQMHKRFHLCGLRDQVWVADLIESVEGLTVADRNTICSTPASKGDNDLWKDLMPAYARCIANQSGGNIADIKELPLETLEADVSPSREYLRELERLHKGVVAYLWLSYRFAGIFGTRGLAFHIKSLVEEKIENVLSKFSFSEAQRKRLAGRREKEILQNLMSQPNEEVAEGKEAANEGEEADAERDLDVEEEETEQKMAEMAEEPTGQDNPSTEKDKFEGSDLGEQLEGSGSEPDIASLLKESSSLTSGGDRFGGEDEVGWEEPEMDEVRPEQEASEPETSEAEPESAKQPQDKDADLEQQQQEDKPKEAAAGGM